LGRYRAEVVVEGAEACLREALGFLAGREDPSAPSALRVRLVHVGRGDRGDLACQ